MNIISQISPVTGAQAAGLVRQATVAALAEDITRTPAAAAAAAGTGAPRPRRWARRVVIGVPVAAALAVAGLVATSAGSPGQHVGPVGVGPARARRRPS